jgi:hypothetical protein
MRYRNSAVLTALLMFPTLSALARPLPSLVPEGWKQEFADSQTRTRRFVSPDGRSLLTAHQAVASRNKGDYIDRIIRRPNEQVTYLRRAATWVVVSGYRESAIFYRKANLACGGTHWNEIELVYPREAKLATDSPGTRIARDMTKYASDC